MSNLVPVSEMSWTPEQTRLITDVVAKGATPDELKLFLYRCKNMGLDPLKPGVIHFVKYSNGPGTIIVGIEGFRSIAARTGKMAGIKRGVTFRDDGQLESAWCEVYRSDWKEPAREEVPFGEYFKPGKNGRPTPWDTMPQTMLKKVAECAALRMAFPDDLGGVYERAEMDQAAPPEEDAKEPPRDLIQKKSPAANPTIIIKAVNPNSENAQKRELSMKIFTAGNRLGMAVAAVNEWIEVQCGSAMKDLTLEELNHVHAELNRLYEEK